MTTLTPTLTAELVLGGDDVYEDLVGVGDALAQLLAGLGIAARRRMGTAAFAMDPAPALFVLDTAVPELTVERVDALTAAVRGGAGLLVVHASAVVPTGPVGDAMAALIGACFASHGPQPHESRFAVEGDPAHPITAGLPVFEVDHEHYALEVATDATPIAWRITADGRESVVVVRTEGAGRVAYLQLGHDTRPFGEPAVHDLVARIIGWLV